MSWCRLVGGWMGPVPSDSWCLEIKTIWPSFSSSGFISPISELIYLCCQTLMECHHVPASSLIYPLTFYSVTPSPFLILWWIFSQCTSIKLHGTIRSALFCYLFFLDVNLSCFNNVIFYGNMFSCHIQHQHFSLLSVWSIMCNIVNAPGMFMASRLAWDLRIREIFKRAVGGGDKYILQCLFIG